MALKTCNADRLPVSLCWAKAHGMMLMVQDLINSCWRRFRTLLAAHAGIDRGVETNAMQFYPEASRAESAGSSRPLSPPQRRCRSVDTGWAGLWPPNR
ncbi:MAG: hypothetical protein R2911_40145 [Caldilineaceae bacterium]